MRKKYFFFDIDGTLTFNRGLSTAPRTMECLDRLRANGHEVFIASGRLQVDAMEMAEKFGIDTLVADGGNSLTLHGEVIYLEPLPRDACIELSEQLERKGIVWGVVMRNEKRRYSPSEHIKEMTSGSFLTNVIDPTFDFHTPPQFMKVFVACPEGEEDRIDFGTLPVVRFNPICIYVEPENKGAGIRRLMDILHAPIEDVVVFGDGTNDVQMFCPEWTSIVMGNAREVLKKKADYITASVEDDGIYKACKHFGWI